MDLNPPRAIVTSDEEIGTVAHPTREDSRAAAVSGPVAPTEIAHKRTMAV